jgi:hypothetical protein
MTRSGAWPAGSRTPVDRLDSSSTHQALHRLTIHEGALVPQCVDDASRAEERMSGVNLVDREQQRGIPIQDDAGWE